MTGKVDSAAQIASILKTNNIIYIRWISLIELMSAQWKGQNWSTLADSALRSDQLNWIIYRVMSMWFVILISRAQRIFASTKRGLKVTDRHRQRYFIQPWLIGPHPPRLAMYDCALICLKFKEDLLLMCIWHAIHIRRTSVNFPRSPPNVHPILKQ